MGVIRSVPWAWRMAAQIPEDKLCGIERAFAEGEAERESRHGRHAGPGTARFCRKVKMISEFNIFQKIFVLGFVHVPLMPLTVFGYLPELGANFGSVEFDMAHGEKTVCKPGTNWPPQ
jgi:hypothetical protein